MKSDDLCCVLLLGIFLFGFVAGNPNMIGDLFPPATTTTTTTTTPTTTTTTTTTPDSETVYHIEGRWEWEDDRHDIPTGSPDYVWFNCYDSMTDAQLDHVEMDYADILYYGMWEYSWSYGEGVRLRFDAGGDPNWVFHTGDGTSYIPVITAGVPTTLYFYNMGEQWDFGEIQITWHTHII